MVISKRSGSIHICVDLKPLNESVVREVHPMLKVDKTLTLPTEARIFSKMDSNSGFWKIPLAEESQLLTTFTMPAVNSISTNFTSGSRVCQRFSEAYDPDHERVVCQINDILIFWTTQADYDARLVAFMEWIKAAGVTLNPEKCAFHKTQVNFLVIWSMAMASMLTWRKRP